MPLQALAPFNVPRKASSSQTARNFSIPAPVGGLNTRDPFTGMQPNDAVVLRNFIPRQQGVELRKGYQQHSNPIIVSGVTYPVQSIFAYTALAAANDKLFAAAAGKIYDVTLGGEPVEVVSPTNSYLNLWWTIQFSTTTDSFLLCVSPGAGYWTYSAASGWVNRTATTTGLPSTVRTVSVWKQRVWFTVEDDSRVYYMNSVNAITGGVTAFPMGHLLRNGGYVNSLINWTVDAGFGIDDFLVVVGSQGDVGVWQGTDPTNASTFELKGIWYVGPVPRYGRYYSPYGGDVVIVSQLGLVPMSKLISGTFNVDMQNVGLDAKIQSVLGPLIQDVIEDQQFNVFTVPSEQILVLGLPPTLTGFKNLLLENGFVLLQENNDNILFQTDIDGVFLQYAMNLSTGSWCEFSNLPMYCSTLLRGKLYFGSLSGVTNRGFYGDYDGVLQNGTGGEHLIGDYQTAFSDFGVPSQLKSFSMVRNVFSASSSPSVVSQIVTQFEPSQFDAQMFIQPTDLGNNNFASWQGAANLGYYGSLRGRVQGAAGTTLVSSVVLAQTGGIL
jgi:hypothetical protein